MASYATAFNWLMESEDPELQCEIIPDAPPGAHSISGINSAAFSSTFMKIAAIPQPHRLAAVSAFYESQFWNQWLAQIDSDEVAKRLFDASVNMGAGTATKLIQRVLWPDHEPDDLLGPATVAAINTGNPDLIVSDFKAQRRQYYLDIAKDHPEDHKYLSGWLVRADK